jgi:hypothetical protein
MTKIKQNPILIAGLLVATLLSSCSPKVDSTATSIAKSPIDNPKYVAFVPIVASASDLATIKKDYPAQNLSIADFNATFDKIQSSYGIMGGNITAMTDTEWRHAYTGGKVSIDPNTFIITIDGKTTDLWNFLAIGEEGLLKAKDKTFSINAFGEGSRYPAKIGDTYTFFWMVQFLSDSEVGYVYLGEEVYTVANW